MSSVPITSVISAPALPLAMETPGRQPCVFLDRDGVFNKTDAFVNTPDQLDRALWPEALQAIARLTRESSARVVLVTNQGGVGSGKMSDSTAQAILHRFAERVEEAGGHMDAIYYCPAARQGPAPASRINARKPEPGMLIQAAEDFGPAIDLADSYMVGDMTTDTAAGKAASPKVTTIMLKTGFAGNDGKVKVTPDHVSADLSEAVDWIVAREKSLG